MGEDEAEDFFAFSDTMDAHWRKLKEAAEREGAEARAWLRAVMERAERAELERDEARREAETMRYWATRPSADLPVADYRFPWEEVDGG